MLADYGVRAYGTEKSAVHCVIQIITNDKILTAFQLQRREIVPSGKAHGKNPRVLPDCLPRELRRFTIYQNFTVFDLNDFSLHGEDALEYHPAFFYGAIDEDHISLSNRSQLQEVRSLSRVEIRQHGGVAYRKRNDTNPNQQ